MESERLPRPALSLPSLIQSAAKRLANRSWAATGVDDDSLEGGTQALVNDTAALQDDDAPELPRFQVGEVINSRYEILNILGEGSMGVVYRVRDQLFPSRRVALKTLRRVTDPEWLALFRAEFRILAELRHAHIAEVYDFEELSGQAGHLFTMEFIEGQVLDAALHSREVDRVWRAVTEMAEALAFVHRQGRLHLDIKPSNAILASDGICKLLDFGLVGMVFTPGQFAGTPIYMAPELLKEQVPDERSDLFSLGITAYQLLTGTVPYSATTRIRDLFAEKLERVVEFPVELQPSIPEFIRKAIGKLCALNPQERFRNAQEFLDATRDEAFAHSLGPSQPTKRVYRSTFVGREQELKAVLDFAHARLAQKDDPAGALLCCVSAPGGMGKSRLLAQARTLLQSESHGFLQGDAYDQDVREYTALAAVLLAASHLAHAEGAAELLHKYGPELVKIVPEFGLPLLCAPSPAFSNGEAERARLISQAASFLVELSQRRPFVVYLNDLQWAGEGTFHVIQQVLQQLSTRNDARLALLVSYRSEEVSGQPIEKFLAEVPKPDVKDVRLQGLSFEQVGAVMGSMLWATVSQEIAIEMHQATGGIPFLVEESTRWLLSQGALAVRNGACVVTTETGKIDLQVEVGKGIVARAALQPQDSLLCLKLLAVCARPIELEHLCRAMISANGAAEETSDKPSELSSVLAALEAAQFVVPVAGKRPRYALAHDRIRESLSGSLAAEERIKLHGWLGAAFEAFMLGPSAAELAVLAAVHQNATPIPQDPAAKTRRCDVNLRAAEVTRQAADFSQALLFLDAADALLTPDIFADHERGMRLTLERALTCGAMLRHAECLRFTEQAIRHARTLEEEGKALLMAIRALTMLSRYDEAVDAFVDFCNRRDPQAKLPKHPGILSFLADMISIRRLIQRGGVEALLGRVNEPEDPKRDLVYAMIGTVAGAVYFARPLWISKLCVYGLPHLIREGVSPSCLGSAVYLLVLTALLLGRVGQLELAIEVGKAARRQLHAVPSETRGNILFSIEYFLRHFDEPLRNAPPGLLTAASHCQQARDTSGKVYALWGWAFTLDWLGDPIDQVIASYEKLTSELAAVASPDFEDRSRSWQVGLAALRGQEAPAGESATFAASVNPIVGRQGALGIRSAAFGVWPGPYRGAEYGFPALLHLSMGRGGVPYEGIVYFLAGVVYLAALRSRLPLHDRLHFRAAAAFVTFQVARRARYNPADYSHRIALLDAERLRNQKEWKRAIPLYERAAHLAKENGWLNEAALVLEKWSEVLIELGDQERARVTLNECILLYKRWQAWAKVEQMERVVATL